MRRILPLAFLLSCFCLPATLWAQSSENHVEVGAFADFFRLSAPTPQINFVGIGGHVAFNVHRNVQLEAEMAYDFRRNFTSTFYNGVTTDFVRTQTRPLTGLFGPKFQTSGPVRFFVTGKVGFVNFNTTNSGALPGFTGSLGAVTNGDTKFALYPGGGMEGFMGPFGLRLEVGDEIYFDNGGRNNFRATFGPVFRF